MEESTKLPVVRLELNTGVFRIKTEEAIYEIMVNPDSSLSRAVEKIVESEVAEDLPAKDEKSLIEDTKGNNKLDPFYKDISEEMFDEIGKMARTLSLSIESMPDGSPKQVDFEKAGADLENVKGSLQGIVEMTEKATMEIMDISDDINTNCKTIEKNLIDIKNLSFVDKNNGAKEKSEQADEGAFKFIEDVMKNQDEIKEIITSLSLSAEVPASKDPEPESEPATEKVKVYGFSLDVVFQTLYELCTNETVKKSHLKPMREQQDKDFDVPKILKAFSDMAPGVDEEDNFFNFPLVEILKILFKFTTNSQNKQILKKMNQSADSIFLDAILPIEGTVEEKEVSVKKKTETPDELSANDSTDSVQRAVELLDENIRALKSGSEHLSQGAGSVSDGYSMIKEQDHKILISTLESTDGVIQKIIANITAILESLTFQDLSGQRIKKVVTMLSEIQVQLLGVLVSFGVKLRKKAEDKTLSTEKAAAMASKEVDKMMRSISEEDAFEDESGPLDQNSVNDLLAELGF